MDGMPRPAARVCIVGDLRVERGDSVVESVQLGSRKARLLLALLAADPSRIRPASEVAEALWPDGAPDSAAATVASLVSRLRRTLGANLIAGGRAGFRLDPAASVDLDEAAGLVEQAERRLSAGQPALAVPASSAALALLTGTALAGLDDSDWLNAVRTRHGALQRRARSAAGRARLAVGAYAGAAEVTRAALVNDPLDEDAARVLMTVLSVAGEPSAALQVFDDLRHRLADELGTDPAPATAALHTEILGGAVPDLAPADRRDDRGELVGRDHEFAELSTAWSTAANGAGVLVLLTGEPGAGKTRLSDELARLARETGGMVLSARCYEAERALFLQPVVEAITDAVTRRPPAEVLTAAAGHLDLLARLVPAIGALVAHQQPTFAAAEVERRRAVEAVSAFLRELARVRPVLLQLDDLHNAGESSIELLHFLRTVLPTAPVLVVATIRTDEGADLLATLAPVATRLEVGPLSPSAVRTLAVAAGRGHRADEIVQRTGGHALFVAEILRGADNDDAIPATLQAAVLRRTGRLGTSAAALLRAGAVLGASFDPQHAAALAGLARPVALADCERALQVGLLRTAGRSYEFANDLVREVLYATTPLPTRLAHHAHAVDLLTGAPEQVAAHATAIDDWPRAARAWLVAADDALRAFAAADGAALAGRALLAAERADDLELIGRALVLRGRARDMLAAYAEAWDDFTAAVDAARRAGDDRLEMIALREIAGNVPVALGNPPAMNEDPLRRCLYLAEQLGARTTEADVLGRLTILAITRLDFATALAYSEQALRTARAAADDRALEFALDARKSCWAYLGEIDRLDSVLAELEPLNRRHGNLSLLLWTLFEASLVPLSKGDYSAAIERIDAAINACRASGFTTFEPFFAAHIAWVHRLAGDLDSALTVGAAAVAAAREHQHSWWLSTAAALHAGTLLAVGRSDDAAHLLTDILPSADVPGAQAYSAKCLGPLAEATGSLQTLHAADALLRSAVLPQGCAWLSGADAYLSVARAWRRHGEAERAHAILGPFLAAAHRVGWTDLAEAAELALQ